MSEKEMNTDEEEVMRWGSFFVGVLMATVVIGLVLFIGASAQADKTSAAGEATLSEAGMDYMLSEKIGGLVVLFATEEGRIVYYDGALFKEME